MKKFSQIALHEYKRHVLRRRFVISLLSVPFFIMFMVLLVFLLIQAEDAGERVGYVDYSGLLSGAQSAQEAVQGSSESRFVRFNSEAQAAMSLQAGDIQGYYVLEEDYQRSKKARLISREELGDVVKVDFVGFVREKLLEGQPPDVARRINEGNNIVVRAAEGSRQMARRDWSNALVPIFTGFIFMVVIFMISGYLMQAIVDEKENRTIEVMVTSVSHGKLIGGKIVGIIGVGFTQLVAWLGMVILVILIGRLQFAWIRDVNIALDMVVLLLAVLLPACVMIAALMAAIGSVVTEPREGQQLTGLVTMPLVLPFWFILQIMNNPNGPISIALSFFPLTSPVALTLRAAFTVIPLWQMLLNVLLMVLFAGLAVWFAGRAFRLGMLQYGRRLSFRELIRGSGS